MEQGKPRISKQPVGYYLDREERAHFIYTNFFAFLSDHILDVGCGAAYLRQYSDSYTGIDISGQPDLIVDLEKGGLPFADKSFETVVCTDVLEHVEPIHHIFVELFRTAKRYVIVSLPNMYALGWRLKFMRGQVISKEYSLIPSNRHKWLTNYKETCSFVRTNLPNEWQIEWEFGYYPPKWWRKGPLYKLIAHIYPNLLATTYWCLFKSCH